MCGSEDRAASSKDGLGPEGKGLEDPKDCWRVSSGSKCLPCQEREVEAWDLPEPKLIRFISSCWLQLAGCSTNDVRKAYPATDAGEEERHREQRGYYRSRCSWQEQRRRVVNSLRFEPWRNSDLPEFSVEKKMG